MPHPAPRATSPAPRFHGAARWQIFRHDYQTCRSRAFTPADWWRNTTAAPLRPDPRYGPWERGAPTPRPPNRRPQPANLRPESPMPAERTREHTAPVAAARRRRLRADQRCAVRRHAGRPGIEVRIKTVRALLSVDAVDVLARAAADPSREVRVAVAKGLGTADGALPTLKGLIQDGDPLVRAAALEALAGAGCPPPLDSAAAALDDPAWQVRRG
ncbi:hypothetical protein G3I60_41335, partial [Streptomyces sp. SID13666]|nr:hypothetical protein [Streptomyces sp. SID13666]